MSLTGSTLPFLLALLAIIAFIALVIGFPRLTKRWAQMTSRGVLAALLCFLVPAWAGAELNDQYAFYVSWSDLIGEPTVTVDAHNGATAAEAAAAKVRGQGFSGMAAPATYPALPSKGSRLQIYTVTGEISGFHNQVVVYLPQDYDPNSASKYPVIMALHGFPGGPTMFKYIQGFFSSIDQAVAEHKMAAPIVVMPQINSPTDLDTECVNSPNGPQAETWLSHDVPAWVVHHFPVQTKRTGWASWGFSYGGWCSALMGVRHPDVFGAGVVVQGYFRPDFSSTFEPFKPDSALGKSYDLVAIARKDPPPVSLWILASKQDTLSYPSTAALVEHARKPLSVTAEILKDGGHRVAVWAPKIPDTMKWLGATLPGFKP